MLLDIYHVGYIAKMAGFKKCNTMWISVMLAKAELFQSVYLQCFSFAIFSFQSCVPVTLSRVVVLVWVIRTWLLCCQILIIAAPLSKQIQLHWLLPLMVLSATAGCLHLCVCVLYIIKFHYCTSFILQFLPIFSCDVTV